MSYATDMLAKAQTAYADALGGKVVQYNGRRYETHELPTLLAQVQFWQQQVNAETARASGTSGRKPLQVLL